MESKSQVNKSSSPKAEITEFNLKPLSQEQRDLLDKKYTQIKYAGTFTIYFGKYKGLKTFYQVATDDAHYTKFMCKCEPCTNNIYLFQKYIKACHPEILNNKKKFSPKHKQTERKIPKSMIVAHFNTPKMAKEKQAVMDQVMDNVMTDVSNGIVKF